MSTGRKRIGEASVKDGRWIVWTIQDIFSYAEEDAFYFSPSFEISGSRWYLGISPNGETKSNSVGWIGLALYRRDPFSPPQGVNCAFGIKRTDGTVEEMGKIITWVFGKKRIGIGCSKTAKRSELLTRKSELAPSDALTVTCSLWLYEGVDSPACMDTLSQNFIDMFNSKRGCDVTFKVKDQEFPAHMCILAARSPIFATMFEADMKEKYSGVVDIVACDPEAFKEFLKYLYSGKAENLSNNAFQLYRIADKYCVKSLKTACIISIMSNLTPENVCHAVILGYEFSEESLKLKTQEFFNENYNEIFNTAGWESLMEENSSLASDMLKEMVSEMKS